MGHRAESTESGSRFQRSEVGSQRAEDRLRISNCEMRIGKDKKRRAEGDLSVVRGPWSVATEA